MRDREQRADRGKGFAKATVVTGTALASAFWLATAAAVPPPVAPAQDAPTSESPSPKTTARPQSTPAERRAKAIDDLELAWRNGDYRRGSHVERLHGRFFDSDAPVEQRLRYLELVAELGIRTDRESRGARAAQAWLDLALTDPKLHAESAHRATLALTAVLTAASNFEQAELVLQAAYRRERAGRRDDELLETRCQLATVLFAARRFERAEKITLAVLDELRSKSAPPPAVLARPGVIELLVARGHWKEVAPLLEARWEQLSDADGTPADRQRVAEQLEALHRAQQNDDLADEWRRRAQDAAPKRAEDRPQEGEN